MKFIAIIFTIFLIGSIACVHKKSNRAMNKYTNKYMNRFGYPTKVVKTKSQDFGEGRTIYLDKHKADCGIGAISQFNYEKVANKISYNTMCIMPTNCVGKCPEALERLDSTLCKVRNTTPNILGEWGGLATNYLDRHKVACEEGEVLTSFQLVTSGRKVSYQYKCCQAILEGCNQYNTPLKPNGNFSTEALKLQVVKTPNTSTQAITGFQLINNYHSKTIKYRVRYCSVKG